MLHFKLPVFPVVLYLERGAGGLGLEQYEDLVFDQPVLTFRYHRVGVPDLRAEAYLGSGNPLAYGLAALMQPGARRPAEVKADCLLRIAHAMIDEARKVLLTNCVETYLRLREDEQRQFEQLIRQPGFEEVNVMRSVYEIEGERRGKQDSALLLLRERFGDLPESAEARVRAMQTDAELEALLRGLLRATSLTELGLVDENNSR
jgi:hypothetical protein